MNPKTNSTWFHIHKKASSTWGHVGRVEKNAYATPKQTTKTVATAKSNRLQMPSCGTL
ncbi:MAG: hypothetical protein M1540_06655 [Candidatus Bathyarchaeota archaeon]|nr:hypothetical protein [Candidatus Bathyarchaeota archaeon]